MSDVRPPTISPSTGLGGVSEAQGEDGAHLRLRLGLASLLTLFVELALIRGTAANVVYLSWFTNFVLLASFLGIGLGFLRVDPARNRFVYSPLLLLGLLAFILLFPAWVGPGTSRSAPALVMLGGHPALRPWLELPLIFAGVVALMASLADEVARCFRRLAPLEAYRWDVAGSLGGIVLFSILSYMGLGPEAWGVVVAAVYVFLLPRPFPGISLVAVAVMTIGLVAMSFLPNTSWSPYNRVTWHGPSASGELSIRVNGRPFQTIIPVSRLTTERPFYGYPYQHLTRTTLNQVLVIGAGSGDDVALALARGAQHIDAVEIDPKVVQLGRTYNPTDPLDDPRVSVHINDGRAFLQQTRTKYDLILFALPDSLTLVSGQGGLRLESYLFTTEAVQTARDRLSPNGVLAMYNYYSPLVFDRYAATMTQVFGHPPCIDRGEAGGGLRSQSVLTIALSPTGIQCTTPWQAPLNAAAPSTDDHPFPYIPGNSIPSFYLLALALVLLASVASVRVSGVSISSLKPYADLFFMGAAFLLLETKYVVSFALLFGTTWFVNSLVFAGILVSVLAGIEFVQRFPRFPKSAAKVLLFLSLAITWIVHPESLLSLGLVPRFALAAGLAFAPVFLANVVFAERFKATGSATSAFGANLLGAILGGVLEYGAIVIGYRDLTILVAILYLLAFGISTRTGHATTPATRV